ncbi:AAA family ATPase [Dehalobacterium formicoaceticum]|uniref:nitrogenase n=1 Tax=Dehalobacterium formicoaceticum TaxID=51515 RepID=A0ABT1YAG9_9FIRM|nr:nitrogenase iron protein NifH [Dehalobacterium formicoaceticum]MCR6546924.1 nitrogenase iron protein NifH [Dehalobacterium formicoaceticum]
MKRPIKIAFYGKGGIGKSTIASNIAAAMGSLGLKVLFIGCDPKSDSVKNIVGGKIKSMLHLILEKGDFLAEEDFLEKGFLNISCIETGGPSPGVGCAGRGIITVMEELEKHNIFDKDWDVIIYDVLGDVVCGGFAVPMREGYVDRVLLVSSSEYMSIYAANNILKSIEVFSDQKEPFLGGIIHNQRNDNAMGGLVRDFSEKVKVPIISEIPFAKEIIFSELDYKTVIEKYPDSAIASRFIETSKTIMAGITGVIPKPLEEGELEQLSKEYLSLIVDEGQLC